MADPTLDDLLKEKGKKEFFDELVDAAIEEKIPETAWQSGEPLRAVMSIVARVLAALWALALPALRAPFLDYATGAWLTLVAWAFYGTKRKGAEFARRDLTVENRGPGFYTVLPGQIRVKNADSKTFTNTTGGTLAAYSGSGTTFPSATMTFTADEAGSGSDTTSGGITELPILAPSGVYVLTNAAAMLGSDEEIDAALRVRAKLAASRLSDAGPWAAYAFTALSTVRPDGNPVDVNRVRVVDIGNSTLEVWLAGNSGPTTGDMASVDTDVWLVYQAILSSVLPSGFTCFVYGANATPITVAITLTVDVDSGLTSGEAVAASEAAVNAYLSRFPIGGFRKTVALDATDSGALYVSELGAKASESAGGIVAADVTTPMSNPVIFYESIPDVTLTITANMVKQ